MAQFRVEFVLDQTTGKYLAEMYHPEKDNELLVRTEALYPTQEAAVLGVVQLFKNAILQFPAPKKAKKPRKKMRTIQKSKKAKSPKRKQKSKRRR